jgi:thioredoxin 1
MANVKALSDSNFDAVLKSSEHPILVDFSATWCQPCKALAPAIESVAKEYEGRLDVYKLDIDDAPETASHFGISGVPTCIFFHGGKEVDRFTGLRDLRAVREMVEKVLNAAGV